jgi:hypothetical protein
MRRGKGSRKIGEGSWGEAFAREAQSHRGLAQRRVGFVEGEGPSLEVPGSWLRVRWGCWERCEVASVLRYTDGEGRLV